MKTRTIKGDTVDGICWRFYGRTTGMTEAVLLEWRYHALKRSGVEDE